MKKLIIIASLGRVRPLTYTQPGDDPLEHAHLSEEPGHIVDINLEHLGSVTTDQSGRFGRSVPPNRKTGMSYGEGHNLEKRLEQQALKQAARTITTIVTQAGNPQWQLISPQALMPRLLKALPAPVRHTCSTSNAGDWTKLPIIEIEKRLLGTAVH